MLVRGVTAKSFFVSGMTFIIIVRKKGHASVAVTLTSSEVCNGVTTNIFVHSIVTFSGTGPRGNSRLAKHFAFRKSTISTPEWMAGAIVSFGEVEVEHAKCFSEAILVLLAQSLIDWDFRQSVLGIKSVDGIVKHSRNDDLLSLGRCQELFENVTVNILRDVLVIEGSVLSELIKNAIMRIIINAEGFSCSSRRG